MQVALSKPKFGNLLFIEVHAAIDVLTTHDVPGTFTNILHEGGEVRIQGADCFPGGLHVELEAFAILLTKCAVKVNGSQHWLSRNLCLEGAQRGAIKFGVKAIGLQAFV